MSGLSINVQKSSIYAPANVPATYLAMAANLGLSFGTLPVRYLGLPLTTKSLTKLDYEPLVDRIRKQMIVWSNKPLSYAGRLQLLKSVVACIVNFWNSVFILPAGCYDAIESLCSAFLWSGNPTDTHKAKVFWSDLCYPKEEGGLGIRSMLQTAKVYSLSLIWKLFTLSDSLCVAWTRKYLMHNGSFWDAKDGSSGSCIWRKLLKVRPLAYKFLRIAVGDGRNTFFWFDIWMMSGKLIDLFGDMGPQRLGISRQAKVADLVTEDQWSIGGRRARTHISTIARIQAEPVPSNESGEDTVLWRHKNGEFRDFFTAAGTWEQVRMRRPQVHWRNVVWFPQGTPRYSFIVWLAVQDRLSTGSRMRAWGITQHCMFCVERDETMDHLFYACPYTYTIWVKLATTLMGRSISPDWTSTMNYMHRARTTVMDYTLLRIAFKTSIYYIWRERNYRHHQQGWVQADLLASMIEKGIRNRIYSLNYKAPHKLEGMMRRWFMVYTP